MHLIFIKQNSQHRVMQTGDSENWKQKQNDIPTKTQWKWCNGICVDLTHKYELKLKLKSTKGSKQSRFQIKHSNKNKKQINQEEYY